MEVVEVVKLNLQLRGGKSGWMSLSVLFSPPPRSTMYNNEFCHSYEKMIRNVHKFLKKISTVQS